MDHLGQDPLRFARRYGRLLGDDGQGRTQVPVAVEGRDKERGKLEIRLANTRDLELAHQVFRQAYGRTGRRRELVVLLFVLGEITPAGSIFEVVLPVDIFDAFGEGGPDGFADGEGGFPFQYRVYLQLLLDGVFYLQIV